MPKALKVSLFVLGGLIGLLVLVAVAILVLVDVDAYKPRLEAAASGALGMEVHVGGPLGISLFPGLRVIAEDVRIRNRGADIVSAKEARLGIDLLALLFKGIRVREIALSSARISIERDQEGKFNFERPEEVKATLPELDLPRISLSHATLLYANKQSGNGFEAGECDLNVRHLRGPGGRNVDFLKHLSFTAQLGCVELRAKRVTVFDLKLSVAGKDGVFDLEPVTVRMFGGLGSGNVQADFSGAVPLYHVRYSLPQFRVEEFLKTLSPDGVVEGSMDFSVNLTMQGKAAEEMLRTADGEASLRGENLTLDGYDLDRELARYESTQNFNLVDVGALFFAGPLGLLVTKGYNFASLFQRSGGTSRIQTLASEWKIERGVAQAGDVAMATNENRIALKGGLDFVNDRFDDVTVALIDAKGCPRVVQKLVGPFSKPVVEKPNVLTSIAGPVLRLLKKGRDLFPGGQCEVFYAGSVAPPK
jgi:AsmA protein